MAGDEGRALAARIEQRVWLFAVAGNILGMAVAAVNVAVWAPLFFTPDRGRGLGPIYLLALATLAVALPGSRLQVKHQFAPVRRWLTAERSPTGAERRRALSIPRRAAANGVVWWLAIGAVAWPLEETTGWLFDGAMPIGKAEVGLAACAAVAAALAYLLVERSLRPLYDVLLSRNNDARSPRRLGMTWRLLIIWALVSAGPLLGIAALLAGLDDEQRLNAPPVAIATSLLAVPSGFVVMLAAARSIADPLRGVQDAMRRVADGDLDVVLPVDDTGEVGLVQSGFNRMVTELRERHRMREILDRHVGVEVTQLEMKGPIGLGGERRDATVLFVDVIGSTQLSNRKSPDEVVTLLNELFAAVVRTVRCGGGWVNKFMGDGALCVFGPPGDENHHATRALRAARALQREIAALQEFDADFDVAIGISTGDVVAGNVGSEERYEYTVIGDAVNEASRLTEEAKIHPSRLLASAQSVQDATPDEAVNWTPAGATILRGRTSPTDLYAPL
jgi:adenylate cyclase